MAAAVKHSASPVSWTYGANRWYLEQTVVGAGASALVIKTTTDATNPPCAAEVASITRSSTGVFVVTLMDAYYAVAFCSGDLDDTANDGAYATIGNWTNLQTSNPAVFTLYTRTAGGTLMDPANGRSCRIAVAFKKSSTGAAA